MLKNSSILSFKYIIPVGLKLAFILLLLAVIFRLAFGVDQDAHRLKAFDDRKEQLDSIVIGNSLGKAFHLNTLTQNGFYVNINGFDVEETIRSATIAVNQSPNLQRIYLGVYPMSFQISKRYQFDDYEERRNWVRRQTPLTFHPAGYSPLEYLSNLIHLALPIEHIQDSFYSMVGYELPNESNRKKRKTDHCFVLPEKHYLAQLDIQVREQGFKDVNQMSGIKESCLDEIASSRAEIRASDIAASINASSDVVATNLERLIRFADKLQQRNIALVIVRVPLTPHYSELPPYQNLASEFEASLNQLRAHPAINIFDYSRFFNEKTTINGKLVYWDDIHLSIHGAILVSQDLIKKLGPIKD